MPWRDALETLDWTALAQTFPYAQAMAACVQDPEHHAEGDVWTHVQMIQARLAANGDDRLQLRLANLFHDCAKPDTRVLEWSDDQGREVVRHPRHSRKGAQRAWFEMWSAGYPLEQRLAVYWTCLFHQKVFHLWKQDDMARKVLEMSFAADGRIITSDDLWRDLLAFARADQEGRICRGANDVDHLDLLRIWLDEEAPVLADAASRIFYFEGQGRSPLMVAPEPSGSHVTVMCGLPGAGKDTAIAKSDLPVISLDAIRDEMDVAPTDNQGRVISAAYDAARQFLRDKRAFIWNATCVTRLMRQRIIGLCRSYDAHVEIFAIDRPLREIMKQNRARKNPVPDRVILALAAKYEPPTLCEAHRVEWSID